MESNLNELTKRVRQEGIEEANQEAEKIISAARKEAESILQKARQDEQNILEKAQQDSQDLKKNMESEIQMAGKHTLNSVKQSVSGLIKAKVLDEPVAGAFKDKDFLKNIIEQIIKNWNPTDGSPADLTLLLPEADIEQLGKYFEAQSQQTLGKGLEVRFDSRMKDGFKIGPQDGSYVISFTDEDFSAFFSQFLREKVYGLLFA